MMMRKRFALPKCLLSKPLGPEKVELLSEEEKRTYNFQKNKFEAMQQKIKKMTRKPAETIITLEDARKLIQGNYHEDEDERMDDVGINEAHTNFLNRPVLINREDINQEMKLDQFEYAIKKVLYFDLDSQKGINVEECKDYIP